MRVLVVDDEPAICEALAGLLEDEGHHVHSAGTGELALEICGSMAFEVIFLDVCLPGMDGLEVLRALKASVCPAEVIMISGHADLTTAVRATRLGAYDFLEKPLQPERVLLLVRHLDEKLRMQREVAALRDLAELESELVGGGPAMRQLRDQIARAAPSDGRILIFGENGTGKELVARRIHELSARREGPFVKLNCAAVPASLIESELFGYEKGAFTGATRDKKGLIEEAHNGTLLLDEIGDMAMETQAKLLRVLQENEFTPVGSTKPKRFDARVIAATNKNLGAEMEVGRFRRDLYYRLNVIPLYVPSLRERVEDIPDLVQHFVKLYHKRTELPTKSFSPEAIDMMAEYEWPGNVRELRNFVERLEIMSTRSVIGVEEVAEALPLNRSSTVRTGQVDAATHTLRGRLRAYERRILREEFHRANGNITRAANRLGMDRANLSRKLKEYEIKMAMKGEQ